MNTMIQTNAELDQIARLIDSLPIAMLTTGDSRGALSSRPMAVLQMDGDGALWFFVDTRARFVGELHAVNLCFCDLTRGTYVSMSGYGEIVPDRQRSVRWWSAFALPWFPEGPDSPNLALLKIVPTAADYWDGPGSRMVRAFGTLASIETGKSNGMGGHVSLAPRGPTRATTSAHD